MSVEIQEIGIAGYQVKHIEEYRFHVIRVIQQHFMDLVRQIAPEVKNHRGYSAALRTHPDKLFALIPISSSQNRKRPWSASSPIIQPSNPSINKCNTPTNS
jgi:hypothetical protein